MRKEEVHWTKEVKRKKMTMDGIKTGFFRTIRVRIDERGNSFHYTRKR